MNILYEEVALKIKGHITCLKIETRQAKIILYYAYFTQTGELLLDSQFRFDQIDAKLDFTSS